MTSSRFRRRRPFNGADADHAPTEQWLTRLRTGDADGTTVPPPGPASFSVTSDPGIMPGRTRGPGPDMFPALPGPPPATAPARYHDAALFGRGPLGFALICGICSTARHATAEANARRHAFDALRDSAAAAGWTLDAFWRWACTDCQQTPRYWPLRTAIHSAPQVPRHWNWTDEYGRPNTEVQHRWSAGVYIGERPPAKTEFWLEVAAEQASSEQVRGARARTATMIRPDGRFITARIISANPGDPDYQGRHRTDAP